MYISRNFLYNWGNNQLNGNVHERKVDNMNLRVVMKNAFMAIFTLFVAGLAMLQGDSGFGDVPTVAIYGIIAVALVMAFVFWRVTSKIDKVNAAKMNKVKKNKRR
jgi:hypothetical protein